MERKLYILLTDTGTLFTRLIKLYTRKPYNHASLSFDPQFNEVYSFGRKKPRNPFIGGFVQENIHDGLLRNAKCAIYTCSVSEEQFQKMQEYIKQIEEKKDNYKYNLIGLFAIALNIKIKRKNAFFCSQFVTSVLTEGNVVEFSKHPSHVTPHDFQQVPSFELMYQGNISDFKKRYLIGQDEEKRENSRPVFFSLRRKLVNVYSFFVRV